MKNVLHVLDVSSIVHTGNHSATFAGKKVNKVPIDGILNLFRYLGIGLGSNDDVLLAFDGKDLQKKKFDESYKAGRPVNASVNLQRDFLFEVLPKCGISCYLFDGYEADDIIDWAVKQFHPEYRTIIMYSGDHDLAHSVQSGVSLKSIRADCPSVYCSNFSSVVVKDETVPFNMISAYKIFCGDSSDGIHSLSLECGLVGKKIFEKYYDWYVEKGLPAAYSVITSKEVLISFVKSSGYFTEEEQSRAFKNLLLVYPLDKPSEFELVPTSVDDLHRDNLIQILSACNDWRTLKCLQMSKTEVKQETWQLFSKFGEAFIKGEYSVDKNLKIEGDVDTSEEVLFLRDFD